MSLPDDKSALQTRMMDSARRGLDVYCDEYIQSLGDLTHLAALSEENAVREVKCRSVSDAIDAVKVSLLYNDTSLLEFSGNEAQFRVLNPEVVNNGQGITITVPSSNEDIGIAAERGHLGCGMMMACSEADVQFLSDVAPLIGQGRLLITPSRFVMYSTGELAPEGGKLWQTLRTNPFDPIGAWSSGDVPEEIIPLKTLTSEVFATSSRNETVDDRGALILPYIKDVSFLDFAKILEDEEYQLSSFRSEIKEYVAKLKSSDLNVDQFRKDVIQPKIDKIERSFLRIVASSNIRIGGLALGSAIMGLATFSTGGVAAAITAAAGTAGIIGGAKEFGDRVEKVRSLQDDPMHLLWRLKRSQ